MAHERSSTGFSLLETIGILAVLVIVASLLLPRLLQSRSIKGAVQGIAKARTTDVSQAIGALKTAVAQHCARFGSLASSNGAPLSVRGSVDDFDRILLAEQILDRPFTLRIGKGCKLRLVNVSAAASNSSLSNSAGFYDLLGQGTQSIPGASHVVEAVLFGLTLDEAKAINDELDGPTFGAGPGSDDRKGRVEYQVDAGGIPREVRIYVAHQ